MKKSGNFLTIALWIWFTTNAMWAQLQFKAKTDATMVGLNETFALEYSFNKEGFQQFKLPRLEGFEVVQGPSQSVSQSWINGKTSYQATYTYWLVPKKKGLLKIGAASVVYKGKKVFSNVITVKVQGGTAAAANVPTGNRPKAQGSAKNKVHLVAVVDKPKLYVGEPVYVEYRLYLNNVGISINKFNKLGNYEGFWVHEFKDQQAIRREATYQGTPSVYYVLKRALLIPQKAGRLSIQPMEVDLSVEVPTGEIDFFGEPFTKTIQQTYQSEAQQIQVKALPIKGQPADFTGAVGDFKMELKGGDPYETNQASALKLVLKGSGNFKLFDLPGVKTPTSIEVYEPETKEMLQITENGIRGNLTQVFTMVPTQKGQWQVVPQKFSYFNPKDQQYHTLQIPSLGIKVLPGKNLPNDLMPIEQNTQENHFLKGLFTGLLLLILGGLIVFWYFSKQKSKKTADPHEKKGVVVAEEWLVKAADNLGNQNEFYSCLEKALKTYLTSVLSITLNDFNKEQVAQKLTALSVNSTITTQLMTLLNQCEMAQYTPIEGLNTTLDYQQAKELLKVLQTQFKV